MKLYVSLLLLLCAHAVAYAQEYTNSNKRTGTAIIGSSTQATQVTDRITQSLRVSVPDSADSEICFVFVPNGTACTTITSPAGLVPCVPASKGVEWPVRVYGWTGQVCAMRKSGTGNITVTYHDPW